MVQGNMPYTWKGVVLASALFATGSMRGIFYHNFMYWSNLAGMHMRSIICAVVYRKVSELPSYLDSSSYYRMSF